MKRETQTQMVKEHLDKYGQITPLQALDEYGIMRLASRMADLKKQGYPFSSEKIKVYNRRGEVCTVCVYKKV